MLDTDDQNTLWGILVLLYALTNNDNLHKLFRRAGRQNFLHMRSPLRMSKIGLNPEWEIFIRPNLLIGSYRLS